MKGLNVKKVFFLSLSLCFPVPSQKLLTSQSQVGISMLCLVVLTNSVSPCEDLSVRHFIPLDG